MHIVNAVFLLFDLIVNSVPVSFHFGWMVIMFALTYVLFAWIYYDVDHVWRYFFVNSEKDIDALWYSLVMFMHVCAWILVYYVAKWKNTKFQNTRRMSDIDKYLFVQGNVDYVDVQQQDNHKKERQRPEVETSQLSGDL